MGEEISQDVLKRAERTWTIFVCAEPDGDNCASGTHPNILKHECGAIKRFHESDGIEPGPKLFSVTVGVGGSK